MPSSRKILKEVRKDINSLNKRSENIKKVMSLFAEKKYEEALIIVNDNLNESWAIYFKGKILEGLERFEEALEAYEKYLPYCPPKNIRLHVQNINNLREKLGKEPFEKDVEILVKTAEDEQKRKQERKQEEEAKDNPIRVKYIVSNIKDLYEPNDNISGIALVTNKTKERKKIKRFEVRVRESWYKLITKKYSGGAWTTYQKKWDRRGKIHYKNVWNEVFILNLNETIEFECNVIMPKAWKPKTNPARFKNWRFSLVFKVNNKFITGDSRFIPTKYGTRIMSGSKPLFLDINDTEN